jgi:anaerobic magnesium-protoporphyrin IX monomethyl ester cyclase
MRRSPLIPRRSPRLEGVVLAPPREPARSPAGAPRRIRRVLLVFPPTRISRESLKYCQMPLGITSLAASLLDRFEVRLLDATAEGYDHEEPLERGFFRYGLGDAEILERIRAWTPDVVGISCLFSPMWPVVEGLLRAIKAAHPGIVTVVGGNHPSFLARECLEGPAGKHLDYIVLGEGERRFRRLLEVLDAGGDPREVHGLAHRTAEGLRVDSGWQGATVDPLDELPPPARELAPLERYARIDMPHAVFSRHRRNTALMTSRGCPACCSFCSSSSFWGRLRVRSVEHVLDEIGACIQRHGIRELHFEDDNLTADRPRAKALLQGIIDRGYPVRWSAPNGLALWTFDEELLGLMKRSGVREIVLAIESGSSEVLGGVMRKPLTLAQAREKVAMVKRHRIRHNAFFMIGLPGETMAQIQQTIALVRELDLEAASLFAFMPLPGTAAYHACVEGGFLPPDFDFVDNVSTVGRVSTEHFDAEEITALVRRHWTTMNLRVALRHPGAFLSRYGYLLLSPANLGEILERLAQRGRATLR